MTDHCVTTGPKTELQRAWDEIERLRDENRRMEVAIRLAIHQLDGDYPGRDLFIGTCNILAEALPESEKNSD